MLLSNAEVGVFIKSIFAGCAGLLVHDCCSFGGDSLGENKRKVISFGDHKSRLMLEDVRGMESKSSWIRNNS